MNEAKKGNSVCTICGNKYNNIAFKGGYICEDCIRVLKNIAAAKNQKD